MGTPQFRNLVFEGAGCVALPMSAPWKCWPSVCGTSAGAINALIHAPGFELDSQHAILDSTDFRRFMDDQFGLICDIRRPARHFGWYRGDFFSSWLGELIARRLGDPRASLQDLAAHRGISLWVVGTNLSTGFAETFSAQHNPHMPVLEALRISMSIPQFFAAVRHGPRLGRLAVVGSG